LLKGLYHGEKSGFILLESGPEWKAGKGGIKPKSKSRMGVVSSKTEFIALIILTIID